MTKHTTSSLDNRIREHNVVIATLILLAATALRFFNLGETSLWYDEAVYANNSMADFASFMENTRKNNSSPIFLPFLYYVFGESLRDPWLIRIPPAIFSILSVGIILALPKSGVSYSVAGISAFILAVSSSQIQYAQEVREYSLSVLTSCLIIFSFLYARQQRTMRSLYIFSIILALTPLLSYGSVFMALAAVTTFATLERSDKSPRLTALATLSVSLLIGMMLSYLLTASFQMQVRHSGYLTAGYPPEGLLASLVWVKRAIFGYAHQAIGSPISGVLALGIIFARVVIGRNQPWDLGGKDSLYLFCAILVTGSIAAAALGLYPFGGGRQQLYATPLFILCTAQAAVYIANTLRPMIATSTAAIWLTMIAATSFAALPRSYSDVQAVMAAVTEELDNVPDETVYVYAGATPAVNFHYPDRNFILGKPAGPVTPENKAAYFSNKIQDVTRTCRISLLFSEIFHHRGLDDEIVTHLKTDGLHIIEDRAFRGARVIHLSRCHSLSDE